MILHCLKTGRWWHVSDDMTADWLARILYLEDYETTETGT